jgi:predicted Zn-dependent peptidase
MNYYHLTTLPNGLRVATEKLIGMESVTFCVSFHVGARQETPEEHGLAHLLEHMAFKGTTKRNARQIAEEFDGIGGNVNAYTSMEQTVYYARVLKQHLPLAVEILADILQNSVFDAAELAREQEVILQEIAQTEDSPDDLVFDYLHEAAYPTHPLGRSILGTPETVMQFTADSLKTFIARHYHSNQMIISAAGNLDHAELCQLVEQHFTGFQSVAAEATSLASFTSGQKYVERELEQLQVMLGFQSVPRHDPDYDAAQILSSILGGGMSSRLFQEVREKRGLAYSVNAFLTTYQDTSLCGVHVASSPDKAPELLKVLVEEVQKLTATEVSEAELTRAKNQFRASILMRRESPTAVAESIARNLQEYGRYRSADELIQRFSVVTPQDIKRVACRIFQPELLALSSIGSQEAMPSLVTVQEMFL